MNLKTESGRSMTEMLGTLAIIGVLSVGGIMGYSYGIDKYRANTIINDVMLRSIDAIAQFDRTGNANLSEWPTLTAGKYTIGLEDETVGIQVDGLPKQLCQMVFDGMINQATVKIGTTEYDSPSDDICGDTNTMVFYMDDGDNALGGGNIPDNEPNLCESISCRECTACNPVSGRCEPANENLTCGKNRDGVCESGECVGEGQFLLSDSCSENADCAAMGECISCVSGTCSSWDKEGQPCQNNTGICHNGFCQFNNCTSNESCTNSSHYCADTNESAASPTPSKCEENPFVARKITVDGHSEIVYVSKSVITWWDADTACKAKGRELGKAMNLVSLNDLAIGSCLSNNGGIYCTCTEFANALHRDIWENSGAYASIWTSDVDNDYYNLMTNLYVHNCQKGNGGRNAKNSNSYAVCR